MPTVRDGGRLRGGWPISPGGLLVPALPVTSRPWLTLAMRTARFRTLIVPILAVAGLVLAACGGGSATSESANSDPGPSAAPAAGVPTTVSPSVAAGPVDGVDLTDIRMEDLTGGGEVALADALITGVSVRDSNTDQLGVPAGGTRLIVLTFDSPGPGFRLVRDAQGYAIWVRDVTVADLPLQVAWMRLVPAW